MAAHSTQLVHRPVRAHPRPAPANALVVAAPPTVGWTASPLAGWLQYLVPLVGGGGSLAFLFAVPGPRPAWLVALVVGAAAASVVAGLALRLAERGAATSPTSPRPHGRPTTWPRPSSRPRSTSTPAHGGSGRRSPRPTACGSAVPPTPTSSPSGSAAARSRSPPRPGSTPART